MTILVPPFIGTFEEPTGPSTQNITPAAFDVSVAFGEATVNPGSVTLSPNAFAVVVGYGGPTLNPGSVSLQPDAFVVTVAFGSPTVAGGTTEASLIWLPNSVLWIPEVIQPKRAPTRPVRVDPLHPSARDLLYVQYGHQVVFHLGQQAEMDNMGFPVRGANGALGGAVLEQDDGTAVRGIQFNHHRMFHTRGFTCIARVLSHDGNVNGRNQWILDWDDSTTAESQLQFGLWNIIWEGVSSLYGWGVQCKDQYDNVAQLDSGTRVQDNTEAVIGVRWKEGGDIELWVDGVVVDSDTSTLTSEIYMDEVRLLGLWNGASISNAFDGEVSYTLAWCRELSDEEIYDFMRDPFQLAIPNV